MKREELAELHYIAPISNVPSILEHGILSHRRAARVQHETVAKPEVQDIRAGKRIPGGHLLHEYANLYVCARNPMLYVRKSRHAGLCILQVATSVLDIHGAVVTDQNAASDWARFAPAPAGLTMVDPEMTFAEYWTHPNDQKLEWRHKSMKCAEVLVPDLVPPSFILGAYVSCQPSRDRMVEVAPRLSIHFNPHLFFV